MNGQVSFGVLGPVAAWDGTGEPLAVKGLRQRAVLARLIVARRRVVPATRLVDDLWDEPGPGALGAVQTFVGALRRALEPDRPPRTPSRLLVTEGVGYVLRAAPDAVDAWRFGDAVTAAASTAPGHALEILQQALALWRGPAYAEFTEERWARGDRTRLTQLRLSAVEQLAKTRLALGLAEQAVPDLEAHLAEHPGREEAWDLLAVSLYRAGRQGDALGALRRARTRLREELGLDPGSRLDRLETDILNRSARLDPIGQATAPNRVWLAAAEAFDRAAGAGPRFRLESTVGVLRSLALTGGPGLQAAREQRLSAIAAAEEHGDALLAARVIGAYDVPAIWTRSDDPEQARGVVNAAERALAALPEEPATEALRCRLLATIGLEMRGTRNARAPQAAQAAEQLARRLNDPALLAHALNARFMQSCTRAGMAPRRDAIGTELVTLAERQGLESFEVLGHLVRMQAQCALGAFSAADVHAEAVDVLAARHERPLAVIFTGLYRALRLAVDGHAARAESAYRAIAGDLRGAGMPGLESGLLPLTLLSLRLTKGPKPVAELAEHCDLTADWGPYQPWITPLSLIGSGRCEEARSALRELPPTPADLLSEALTCMKAVAAVELGEVTASREAHAALLPAAAEIAGAGSGLISFGPVEGWLSYLDRAARRSGGPSHGH